MIKYFPVQNEDGAIEAWSFINDRNDEYNAEGKRP